MVKSVEEVVFALKLVLLFEGSRGWLAGFVCFCLLHGGNWPAHRIVLHRIALYGMGD